MFDTLKLRSTVTRTAAVSHVRAMLVKLGLGPSAYGNVDKPWGVEFRIEPDQTELFVACFFGKHALPAHIALRPEGPELMLIQQAHRLSWHYHERKEAFLRVMHGSVGATVSLTDDEPPPDVMLPGDTCRIVPFTRHRLASLSGWSVIAEISLNADPEDTRRLRDDYGRGGNG